MKAIEITVKLQVEVNDEVAEHITTAPGFITVNGVMLGEEGLKVGFINEDEVEPIDVSIEVVRLKPEQAAFVAG